MQPKCTGKLLHAAQVKRSSFTETGWPVKGRALKRWHFHPKENAMKYFINTKLGLKGEYRKLYFSSFDESWKTGR